MELKDIFGYIGVEADSVDDFQKKFDERFLTRDNAVTDPEIRSKVTGSMAGGIVTHLRRVAKDQFGQEISKEEIEGKKVEEIMDMVTTAAKATYEDQISKLSEAAKSAPKVEEAIEEWKGKYEKVLGEKTNFETLLSDTKKSFEDYKVNIETEKKTGTINSKVESMLSQLEWSEQVNDFTKTGFLTTMNKGYSLDLNEHGDLQIKKDGNLIPNPSKHGDFMEPLDIYKMEAEKNKLLKAPNAKSSTFVNTPAAVNEDGIPKRKNRAAAATGGF